MSLWLFGCKVRVSPLFFSLIALLLLIDRTGMMPFVLCAIAVHESGHLIVMRRFEMKPVEVALLPFEINIQKRVVSGNSRQELAVSAAGVLANLLVAALAAAIYFINPFVWALRLLVCNLVLGLFEALPIDGLDGYHTLVCLFCMRHGPGHSLALTILSYVTLGVLAAAGAVVFWNAGNPLPLLFCLYLGILFPYREKR